MILLWYISEDIMAHMSPLRLLVVLGLVGSDTLDNAI